MINSNTKTDVELARAERKYLELVSVGDTAKVFEYLYSLKLDLLTQILRKHAAFEMSDAVIKQWILRGCTQEITRKIRSTPMPVRQIVV